MSLESAEKIKLFLGQTPKQPVVPENLEEKTDEEILQLDDLDISTLMLPEEIRSVSQKTLVEGIINPD